MLLIVRDNLKKITKWGLKKKVKIILADKILESEKIAQIEDLLENYRLNIKQYKQIYYKKHPDKPYYNNVNQSKIIAENKLIINGLDPECSICGSKKNVERMHRVPKDKKHNVNHLYKIKDVNNKIEYHSEIGKTELACHACNMAYDLSWAKLFPQDENNYLLFVEFRRDYIKRGRPGLFIQYLRSNC